MTHALSLVRASIGGMILASSLLGACGAETPDAAAPTAPAAVPVAQEAAPVAAAADDANWKYFGAPFSVADALPAATVLSNPEGFAGKPVRFRGELSEVCQKAGCWAVVRDEAGHSLRVTMKDHAFGIDKDTQNRACDVEGELVKKAVDPERLAHLESEGAKNHPEAGKTEAWEVVASAVAVSRAPAAVTQ